MTKPGPARIRVTLSRSLTPAEQEHIRETGRYVRARYGEKFRLDQAGHIWYESDRLDSRPLFRRVEELLQRFVNVYPISVRTFRERVRPSRDLPVQKYSVQARPSDYATGIQTAAQVEHKSSGLFDDILATFNKITARQRFEEALNSARLALDEEKSKKGVETVLGTKPKKKKVKVPQ